VEKGDKRSAFAG